MDAIKFGENPNPLRELTENLSIIYNAKSSVKISSSKWIRPLTVLPVCAALKACRVSLDPEGIFPLPSYLNTICFPEGIGNVAFKKDKTYLPITCVELPTSADNLNDVATQYAGLFLNSASLEQRSDLETVIKLVLGEMTTNVLEHSSASNYWLFAQKWEKKEVLEFCIVDDGIGFRNCFANAGLQIESDKEAITKAIQGVSAKNINAELPGERGHGLGSTTTILTSSELQGAFLLMSGNGGYVKHFQGVAKAFQLPVNWSGVIVCGRFKIPNKNFDIYKYLG